MKCFLKKGANMANDGLFKHSQYLVRSKFFKLFGKAFHIYDPQGNLVLYSKMKAFKLREDIRLYTGEDMQTEVLLIAARKILDFGLHVFSGIETDVFSQFEG